MKVKITNGIYRSIYIWLMLQSLFIIGASIFAFLTVEMGAIVLFQERNFSFGNVLGMILPMCAFLGVINFYLFKSTYRYFSILIDAIEKVSNGDFNIRLDENSINPFSYVHKHFNKMVQELQNVQILRSDFTNSYSHEFKTPIVSIKGFADLLLESDVDEEDLKTYLSIISYESGRLAELANSSILLSCLESQEIIVDKKEYELDEQLRRCSIILASQWNEKHITLDTDLPQTMFLGNAEIMQHLWLNLLSNAIKYTPENGEISISLTKDTGIVIVKISDSGIGMNEETVNHIFEKYYKDERSNGLGLGLSIVKRIIEICDGTIKVISRGNEGSTFIVTLPNSKTLM